LNAKVKFRETGVVIDRATGDVSFKYIGVVVDPNDVQQVVGGYANWGEGQTAEQVVNGVIEGLNGIATGE
jgi:hypothetical protein